MKMEKKIMLPALAAFMILVMVATAFPAASAVAVKAVAARDPVNLPLSIVTIAEDDEGRDTGIMILCVTHDLTFGPDSNTRAYDPNTCSDSGWLDKWASYKIIVLFADGEKFFWVPGTTPPFSMVPEFIEKDTVEPKVPAFAQETLKKEVTDLTASFAWRFRWKYYGGFFWSVGDMDVYYTGVQHSEYVAPYIIDLQVSYTSPTTKLSYYGADIQDLCILAWPFNDPTDWQKRPFNLQKPERVDLTRVPDPLDGFAGCEDATLFQRSLLGSYIPTAPQN
jgi:hypothetical protein